MNDRVLGLSLKLLQTLGKNPDPDFFSDDDAWTFIAELCDFQARGKNLSAASLRVLQDLGWALGLRPGAPLDSFPGALVRAFGPAPFGQETIFQAMNYVRGQVNGQFEVNRNAARRKLLGQISTGPFTPVTAAPKKAIAKK